MRLEGKVSKVAICERCEGIIYACHVDKLNKTREKEFTELANEGFTIKTETISQTQAREFVTYGDCTKGTCGSERGITITKV